LRYQLKFHKVRSKPTRSNWVHLFILSNAFIRRAPNTPSTTAKRGCLVSHTRNNGENNRGESTALLELVLETLPKIYLLPTQDSMGTIRKEVQFIFSCVIAESTSIWHWTPHLWRLNLVRNGKEWSTRICTNEGGEKVLLDTRNEDVEHFK
jgi:hypothetical protein